MSSPELHSPRIASRPAASLLWVGVMSVSGWIALIAFLTLTSSNPVTLNQLQILQSDLVVIGQVPAKAQSSQPVYVIEPVPNESWPIPDRKSIHIANLPKTAAQPGQIYLFPLTREEKEPHDSSIPRFLVTPSHLPNGAPLIYPDSPEVRQQLAELLKKKSLVKPAFTVPQPTLPTARD